MTDTTTTSFDFSVLTAAEVAYIERQSGISIARLGDEDNPPPMADLAAACYVVWARRWGGDPAMTINRALQKPLSDLTAALGWDTEEDEDDEDAEAILNPGRDQAADELLTLVPETPGVDPTPSPDSGGDEERTSGDLG